MAFIDLYGTADQAIAWADSYIPEITNIRDTYATPSEFGGSVDFQLDQTRSGYLAYAGSFIIGQDGSVNSGTVTDIYIETDDNYLATYLEDISISIDELMALEGNVEAAIQWEMEMLSGDDVLSGSIDGGSVKARMLGGNDFIELFSGNENEVNGNMGSDTFETFGGGGSIRGGSDNDLIQVFDGNYIANGNKGNDTIINRSQMTSNGITIARGGSGDDMIINYEGNVAAYGDLGSDTFVPWLTGNNDHMTIADFSVGEDILDLSNIGSYSTRVEIVDGMESLFVTADLNQELAAVLRGVTSI